jgi:hypothetical protein
MRPRFLSLGIVILFIFLFKVNSYYLDKKITSRSRCPEKVISTFNELKNQIHPYKIVFNPWNGRHNVHGVFMLPIEDNSSKMLVINIPGAGMFCGGAHNVGTSFEAIQAKPGYYLLKTNFRTRTSIWLMARGFANQLKDPRNWILINY